jgi:hypothetical protein
MKAVETFKFEKDVQDRRSGKTETIVQDVVVNRGKAPDNLSRLTCVKGQTQCVTESMLKAKFYGEDGVVQAKGVISMQLGSATSSRRHLQEGDDGIIEQEFVLPIDLVASLTDDNGGSKAWFTLSESEGSSKNATIGIIVLLVVNVISWVLLIAQLPRFRGSRLYLT